jgi:hypothetical protein
MLEESCDEDLQLKKQTYDLASETITKFSQVMNKKAVTALNEMIMSAA